MNQPISGKVLKEIKGIRISLIKNVLIFCICVASIPFFYTKGYFIIDKMSSKSIDQYSIELQNQLTEINEIDAVTKNERRLKEISRQNTSIIFNFVKKIPKEINSVTCILLAFSAFLFFINIYTQYRCLKLIKNIQNAQQ